jgi:hypothetical protein
VRNRTEICFFRALETKSNSQKAPKKEGNIQNNITFKEEAAAGSELSEELASLFQQYSITLPKNYLIDYEGLIKNLKKNLNSLDYNFYNEVELNLSSQRFVSVLVSALKDNPDFKQYLQLQASKLTLLSAVSSNEDQHDQISPSNYYF